MEIQGVNVVFFWVADLDRSVAWYTEKIGIEAGPRYGDWQEFRLPGSTRFAVHGGRSPDMAGGGAAVAFTVPDLDAAIEELAGKNVQPIEAVTDTGAARFVTYEDPDGNRVQLLEPRR